MFISRFLVCALLVISSICPAVAQGRGDGPVYVILWFDTEDYLLPASDDSAKRLAELLTSKGIRATFKVVGEKARTLERRGRTDVIAALKKHDIGYHSNFHSVHPTPSEYLAEAGFLDGVGEFVRREGGGAADVRRIFGVPTLVCYGQPGSSWGSQAIAALQQIGVAPHGVPCYVDDGTNVGLNQQPFWYENALVVYNMGRNQTRMDLHDPSAVEPAKKKVGQIADQLRAEGGGLISIFYHPCEWVHQTFWDGFNFARGANPPREAWKAPPQRSPEQTEAAFQRFSEYIDHIKTIPGVRFISAGELPELYPDPLRNEALRQDEVRELASAIAQDATTVKFREIHGKYWSAADQFEVLTRAMAEVIQNKTSSSLVKLKGLFGPDQSSETTKPIFASWAALDTTVLDAAGFIDHEGRVPSRVFVGADSISPADFLEGLAKAYLERSKPDHPAEGITFGKERVALDFDKYIAKDTPDLFGGWVIHKEGFRAPKIMDIARLQAWTLKPAVLKTE
jgi:hypothetical protein